MKRRVLAASLFLAAPASADVRLPRILSDGVVLQREQRVEIFGFADPQERVRVHASWGADSEEALTDQEGTWRTTIVTPAAGGPFTLDVRGRNTLTVRDVLVGEVWLCSGQSNMEMPVAPEGGYTGALDWENVIAQAGTPSIRMFTVENDVAAAPRDDVHGSWTAVSPATAGRMSATAYFFGRKLFEELKVPIGLVDATWGGTPAESWTSGITLRNFPEYVTQVADLERRARDPKSASLERARAAEGWVAAIEESDRGIRAGFARTTFDDSSWTKVHVPGAFAGKLDGLALDGSAPDGSAFDGSALDGSAFDGVIWVRRAFDLRANLSGRDLVLETGPIHDFDVTWFDGERIGAGLAPDSFRTQRSYAIPARLATPGRHVIALRVLDTGGPGGIGGGPGSVRLRAGTETLALDGEWSVHAGAPIARVAARPTDLDIGPQTPTALYNAMIAPLTHFAIRGVIWYQGESNRLRAFQYKTLFPALIADWRARFSNAQMPFDFVQIAPFTYAPDRGEAAELREAQRLALQVPHTAMVVTSDIGDERDIHPKNKQEVGRRLASLALNETYGRSIDVAQPASPARDDRPWITESARTQTRWNRTGDILTLGPPIQDAQDAVPLGNGLLGALVWGDDTHVNVTIDRADVWNPREPDVSRRAAWSWKKLQALVAAHDQDGIQKLFVATATGSPAKIPIGHVEIRIPAGGPREYGLDLAHAEARVTLRKGALHAFVSTVLPVVMVRLEGVPAQSEWTADTLFGIPNLTQIDFHVAELRTVADSTAPHDGAGVLRIEGPGGITFAIAAARHVEDAYTDIAISVATLAEDSDPMQCALDRTTKALTASYAQRLAEHQQALGLRVGTATVSIGDPALQTQYDVARHLLVSGSQRGSPPMSSHGVWTPDSMRSSGFGLYSNDMTTQTTYGSYATAGLLDCGVSLLELEWRLLPRMRELARDVFGVDGAVLPGLMGLNGAPIGFHPQYALSPTNGAWMADLFARHWRFTQDMSFLRGRAYPWCSAIGEALVGLLRPDDHGKLHLPLSTSPVIHGGTLAAWLTPNSSYDLAAMRALFTDLISMARALREDKDALRWSQVVTALDDFALDPRGGLALAPGEALQESHAYLSHALAIHPLGLISIEGPERERSIVDATLDTILDQGTAQWTGSTFAWFACLAARGGRAETALQFLRDYERSFTLRNGMHAVSDQSGDALPNDALRPFSIEGNMLAMEAVHEMLLQSWGGVVRVFPATSVTWPEASFEQLRAEGGFVVSAHRKGGSTSGVRVRATVAATLRLRDPFDGGACTWSRHDIVRDGADWTVSLVAGEELVGTRDAAR